MISLLLLLACDAEPEAYLTGPGECSIDRWSVEDKRSIVPITSKWEFGGVLTATGDCEVYCDDPWADIKLEPLEQDDKYEVFLRGAGGLLDSGTACYAGEAQYWVLGG